MFFYNFQRITVPIMYRSFSKKLPVFCRNMTHCKKSNETSLLKQIRQTILFKGPITVAEYMKHVLTNASGGYYMNRDVFGLHGDFITSPEISQMFGELVAIWCVNEWMHSGSSDRLQVVELGPGRGTLAEDMLRVFARFPGIRDAVSLHLVEVSPYLSNMQYKKLACAYQPLIEDDNLSINGSYKSCVSAYNGVKVHWYKQLSDVPLGPSFYVAHEFFDALPIHKFQKVKDHWREVMIDLDEQNETPNHLRFVLMPADTAASRLLLDVPETDTRDHIEICPEAAMIMEELSHRISDHGGFSLIADYGHNGTKTDTFRAFRSHQLFDVLSEPGTADLTADVDFSYLKQFIKSDEVASFGPVTQEQFLHRMGIVTRLEELMHKANDEQQQHLLTGYDMLTNPNKMGDRFKFLALMHQQNGRSSYVPAGFSA